MRPPVYRRRYRAAATSHDTMKAVIVVAAALLSTAAAQTCTDGFTLVGSACYQIFTDTPLTWQNAKSHCRGLTLSDGKTATLARVETCEQLHELTVHITAMGYPIFDYWLGGTTVLDPDGLFRWDSTGALVPLEAPLWFPGQPDYPVVERTLSLSKTGLFADENENIEQRFICQLL